MKTNRLHFLLSIFTICVIIIIPAAHSQCIEDEQLSLLQLKKSLEFNHSMSTKLVTWNASNDCCSWVGVSCSREGRVLGLDISGEHISRGIDNSSSLFHLHYLQSLNLADNFLACCDSQSIPCAIGKLLNLRYLNLSNSRYEGKIPIEISRLRRLEVLDLSRNTASLKPGIPNLHMLIQNLTQLRELHLDDVQISEQGSEWCRAVSSSLPNLRVLSMSSCNLSGPLHRSLAKLHSLTVINLEWNDFNSPVPRFFANFSNLTVLRLLDCMLHGTFPIEIFQLPSLQIIDLSFNDQLYGSLPEFPSNGSLQYLSLRGTKFSGLLPNSIGSLKLLSTIDIQDCNFTGSIPMSMTNLTQLVSLQMAFNNLEGPVPSFSKANNLEHINLSGQHSLNGLSGTIDSTHWRNLTKLSSLSLSSNKLNGSIPSSLFSSPWLHYINLSRNQFSGRLPEISDVSSYFLKGLDLLVDLSHNNLEGHIPMSIFSLRGLDNLDLSSNNLSLVSKLSTFPNFLRNQSNLQILDLSENQINGKIPTWIWSLSNLELLNLSCNSLYSLGVPSINLTNLHYLDLHSNQLHGKIPTFQPPCFVEYLDFSRNYFSSTIPSTIGDVLSHTRFLSSSSNNLNGVIPESLCSSIVLEVLDLSTNHLSGTIPQCLTTMDVLEVLNVRRNNLTRVDKFSRNPTLKTLDISRNQIQGQFLKSLVNCTKLEVLNLGNNLITAQFPCFLRNTSTLRVLVLRSNKFYGGIGCHKSNGTWPLLQIIDLAHNNFSGEIPGTALTTWHAMRTDKDNAPWEITNNELQDEGFYCQEATITVTNKGIEMELVNVLPIFMSIDFSSNNFNGSIPKEIGELQSLLSLNLSNNAFTGAIPTSLSNISQLESLDLSKNKLRGQIPPELTKLNFLEFLNLSNNQLVGRIPSGAQFLTFDAASFQANKGLWGTPFSAENSTRFLLPKPVETGSNPGHEIDWDIICPEIGFACGIGTAILSLLFCKRWRKWYYRAMYNMLLKIFPQLEQRLGHHRRHVYVHQRYWRR